MLLIFFIIFLFYFSSKLVNVDVGINNIYAFIPMIGNQKQTKLTQVFYYFWESGDFIPAQNIIQQLIQ